MNANAVGPEPSKVKCPYCNVIILSMIRRKPGAKAHLAALILCLCQCWLCVCIPYVMDSCLNTDHYCPKCCAFLGTYER